MKPSLIKFLFFLSISHSQINANFFATVYGYVLSLHETLRWNFDYTYQKEKTAEVVRLAAQQARDRSLLYKLNVIQLNDIELSAEQIAPLNYMIERFCGKSIEKPAQLRSRDLIKADMEQNLKLFDHLIPNLKNFKTNDDYRYAIVREKKELKAQINTREAKKYSLKIKDIFEEMAPSKSFCKELKWHEKREAEIKIKRFHPILVDYSSGKSVYLF